MFIYGKMSFLRLSLVYYLCRNRRDERRIHMIYSKIKKEDFGEVQKKITGIVQMMDDCGMGNMTSDLISFGLSSYESRGSDVASIKINSNGRFEAVCW